MFRVMIGFLKGIGTLAKPWWVWVGVLIAGNMVAPLFFLGTTEAWVVLMAFLFAAGIQMTLFHFKGFVRLLGIGHIIPWAPMLVWLWLRLEAIGTGSALGKWIVAVIVADGVSLLIDFFDVYRYLAGERTPTFTLQQPSGTAG